MDERDRALGGLRRRAERQAEERGRGLGRIREAFRRRDEEAQGAKRRWVVDPASRKAPFSTPRTVK